MTVSVIVPVYNAQAQLPDCLKSIQAQSYTNMQIILVDDGSTDASTRICDNAAALDTRILVIHQDNGGPPVARNTGLDAACGQWVMFVDADDRIERDYVERMLNAAQRAKADIVASDCTMHEGEHTRRFGMLIPDRTYTQRNDLWRAFLSDEIPWSLWAKLYRADIFENMRFRSDDFIAEDLDINARLFTREQLRIATIDYAGYHYHIETGSVDHTFTERHLCQLKIFERVYQLANNESIVCDASAAVFYEERVLNALRKAIDADALEGTTCDAFERAIALHRDEALASPWASKALKRRLRASKLGLGVFSLLHAVSKVHVRKPRS